MFYAQNVTRLCVKLTMRKGEKLDFGCIFSLVISLHLSCSHLLQYSESEWNTVATTNHRVGTSSTIQSEHFHLWVNMEIYYANCKIGDSTKSRKVHRHQLSQVRCVQRVHRAPLAAFMSWTKNRQMCVAPLVSFAQQTATQSNSTYLLLWAFQQRRVCV